ncbi:putative MFS-type transporter C18.02 [Golovinomyces cichoracearum]|uniref:Putative MFS-type transporter C18.02 n=1 Tax=Golovinomyces cichoracearum TaxID=62708 RepID=A0A420I6N3_9PEZI|nr:putative MFS-type transporter C18.02 [Golovinomyces cichoracearum]
MSLSRQPPPRGLRWRSSTSFIITTISMAMFTDLFLYGLIVPTLPFILSNRLHIPSDDMQKSISLLLSFYGGASVLISLPAGYIADLLPSRQPSFLCGLSAMFISTALLWIGQSWKALVIARIFQGFSAAVVWSVGLAMILDTVGNSRLAVVLNGIFGFICAGELIAPVAGGIIYDYLGEGWVFGTGFMLLTLDLILRIFVVEKRVMKRNGWDFSSLPRDNISPDETAPLISSSEVGNSFAKSYSENELSEWKLPKEVRPWQMRVPIFYLASTTPRLLTSLALCFTHAMTLAIFDATIPIQSLTLFSFNSRSAGLLFIPLLLPYLLLSPVAGLLVNRYGSKMLASLGLVLLATPLLFFGIVHTATPGQENYVLEVTKFSVILVACGVGLAAIGSQSLVDASIVIENYEKANPDWFPNGGPYAQLYAMNSMIFSLGLTIGPIVAGYLNVKFGYTIMNLSLAGWCVLMSLLCAYFLGGKRQALIGTLSSKK